MKALISPNEAPIYYISEWILNPRPKDIPGKYIPVWNSYPNSCRVAEVEPDDKIFPVADPLFWTTCPDDCVADQWWYDTVTQTVQPIVNAPAPTN